MYLLFFILFFLPIGLFSQNNTAVTYELSDESQEKTTVTYELNHGRFGDNLISYVTAKQLALHLNAQFLYVPFHYSDQLKLHKLEKQFSEKEAAQYGKKIIYDREKEMSYFNKDMGLLVTLWKNHPVFYTQNYAFRSLIKEYLMPTFALQYIDLPDNMISVALHIRIGGGYDSLAAKIKNPRRFPPLHFFADQLNRILYMLPNQKFYVHTFTDDPHPEKIVSQLKKSVISDAITYGYREADNRHDLNVLEDFYNMMRFDILVRPSSCFSKLVQYLGDHKIVFIPQKLHFTSDSTWVIDTIQMVVSGDCGHQIFGKIPCSKIDEPFIF